ncbi:MAG: adenylosuccinate lyase [Tindallia sp. MSAO_Bac2]|nr:MAG: adenylosuccinate lyase [Tindallia sp. MSAO_Bac2]
MINETNVYQNPLVERYASKEMLYLFSHDYKFSTWRKLWIALAESQKELGLEISDLQIEELKEYVEDINYSVAAEKEKEIRHDVMAHVYAYGIQCPTARPIIHLGATSAFVGDNTDLVQMKHAMQLIHNKTLLLMKSMANFCEKYKDLPTLGFTHFQPAQLTTVGKRGSLWLYDIFMDLENIQHQLSRIKFRGVKGTTGTQASFLKLFNNDHKKVEALDQKIAQRMGFSERLPVTGQTYSRKIDYEVVSTLSGIAQSLHKISNDIRLLQHLKEIEEPFEKHQVGSSAMAYKRNPMRSERIAALSRYIINLTQNTAMTQSSQWFERTLDDSANKRLTIPEAFLATDAILDIAINVFDGLVVYEKMIQRHIEQELPFMLTENILMEAVQKGGDRQELHERIRVHSMEASREVKKEGKENDLLARILEDDAFDLSEKELNNILHPNHYIGRSSEQVTQLLNDYVYPVFKEFEHISMQKTDLKV